MAWMAWTVPTAAFFIVIALMLTVMTVWEARSPCVPRQGFIPLVTTRGDRLFIGLMASAFANLAWVGLTDASQWYGLGIAIVLLAVTGRYG